MKRKGLLATGIASFIFIITMAVSRFESYKLGNSNHSTWTRVPASLNQSRVDSTAISTSSVSPVFFSETLKELKSPTGKIKSVEALLSTLPSEMLSHYNLVYQSRSLQDASVENPRVIISSFNGNDIFAFNGEMHQAGFDTVEAIHFHRASKTFEFREIVFGRSSVYVSDRNPKKCLVCHGLDPRPNWDTYPLWPGIYGSDEDLANQRAQQANSTNQTLPEVKNLTSFFSAKARNSRYKFLRKFRPAGSGYVGFLAGETISPNTEFTITLGLLNFQRVSRILAQNKKVLPFRFAIVGALECPETSYQNFFPTNWFSKTEIESILKEVRDINQLSGSSRYSRENKNAAFYPLSKSQDETFDYLDRFAGLYLVAKVAGVNIDDFGTEFSPRSFAFNTGFGPQEKSYFLSLLTRDLLSPIEDLSCSSLAEKSRTELSQLDQKVLITNGTREFSPIYRKCQVCHDGQFAPRVSFDNPKILSSQIAVSGRPMTDEILYRINLPSTAREKMPQFTTLSPEEKTTLRAYIKSLSQP
jgi:hypothetical protein